MLHDDLQMEQMLGLLWCVGARWLLVIPGRNKTMVVFLCLIIRQQVVVEKV